MASPYSHNRNDDNDQNQESSNNPDNGDDNNNSSASYIQYHECYPLHHPQNWSTTCSNTPTREEEMLNRLQELLQTDEIIGGLRGETSMVAETLLLDADEEDYNAHETPFFSSLVSWENQLQKSLDKIVLEDDEVNHQGDGDENEENSQTVEHRLQMQMEQASLSDSIDSSAYEYRDGISDLMGDTRMVVDTESYHQALDRFHPVDEPSGSGENGSDDQQQHHQQQQDEDSHGSLPNIDLRQAEEEVSFEEEDENDKEDTLLGFHESMSSVSIRKQNLANRCISFSPFVTVVESPLVPDTTDDDDDNNNETDNDDDDVEMDASLIMEEGNCSSGFGLADALQPYSSDEGGSSDGSSVMPPSDGVLDSKWKRTNLDAGDANASSLILDDTWSMDDSGNTKMSEDHLVHSIRQSFLYSMASIWFEKCMMCFCGDSNISPGTVGTVRRGWIWETDTLTTRSMAKQAAGVAASAAVAGNSMARTAAKAGRTTCDSCVQQIGIALGIAIIALALSLGFLLEPTMDLNPASVSSCIDFADLKLGRLDLIFDNIPMNLLLEKEPLLETLFVAAYNNASGMCEGMFQRVLKTAFIESSTPVVTVSTTIPRSLTSWYATVNCNGCPDSEPLFSSGVNLEQMPSSQDNTERLLESSHRNKAPSTGVQLSPSVTVNDFSLRFIEYMNAMLPGLFQRNGSEVVYFATISLDTGSPDQVFHLLEPETTNTGNKPLNWTAATASSNITSSSPTTSPSPTISPAPTLAPTPYTSRIIGMMLKDSTHQEALGPIDDGYVIDWNALNSTIRGLNIEVFTEPNTNMQIDVWVNGTLHWTEHRRPFMLGGGDFYFPSWNVLSIPTANLTIKALTVYRGLEGLAKEFRLEIRGRNTPGPTQMPSSSPSDLPSTFPTNVPSQLPTETPTYSPTSSPTTESPSTFPTNVPSQLPTETPTYSPTSSPTTESPTTSMLTVLSGNPSASPTTQALTTGIPSTPYTSRITDMILMDATHQKALGPIDDGYVIDWNTLDSTILGLNIQVFTEPDTNTSLQILVWVNGTLHWKESARPFMLGGGDVSSLGGDGFPHWDVLSIPTTNLTIKALPIYHDVDGLAKEVWLEIRGRNTLGPTQMPSSAPTNAPSTFPTYIPSQSPTETPTYGPTSSPTTESPTTSMPTVLSGNPSASPTSLAPTTASPSKGHTSSPTATPTTLPTASPTDTPKGAFRMELLPGSAEQEIALNLTRIESDGTQTLLESVHYGALDTERRLVFNILDQPFDSTFELAVLDAAGNGICCGGEIKIYEIDNLSGEYLYDMFYSDGNYGAGFTKLLAFPSQQLSQ